MISVTISGFRCYIEEVTFNFIPGEVIRIKGRSGIGKTTIFEAIQWVLYNYPTTNIYPRNTKLETMVRLTLPWQSGTLRIERRKNPGLLVLTMPDGRIEQDDIAQARIDAIFGSRDIWRACCYLPQGENCPLLSFSNAQRMEILESLAFLNEKPEEIINKIVEEAKRAETEFKVAEKILLQEQDKLEQLQKPIEDAFLDDATYDQLVIHLQEVEDKIKVLQDEVVIAKERKKQRQSIKDRLAKITTSLSKLEVVDVEEITRIESKISQLQHELTFSQQGEIRHKLVTKRDDLLSKLKKLPVPKREYSKEEYQEAFSVEKKIIEEKKIAATYKLNYNPKLIEDRIKEGKSLLDRQKDAQIWTRIKDLQKRLASLDGPDVSSKDLDQAKEELRSLERSIDVLKCPACKRSVRYLRGGIVLSETSPVPADKIKKMREALTLMEQAYTKCQERQVTTTQLDSLLSTVTDTNSPDLILKSQEIKKLEQEISQLGRLVFPKSPIYSSQDIIQSQEYFTLQKELQGVEEELSNYPSLDQPLRNSKELLALIEKQNIRLKYLQDTLPRREVLENQEKACLLELEKLPTLDQGLDQELFRLQNEQKDVELKLTQHEEAVQAYNTYVKQENLIIEQEVKVNKLNEEWSAALRLRDLAQHEVCEILEEKIISINTAIAEICNKIFSDPITVELSMLKTTKSTKVTKPCAHLKIWYKGGEFDSLSQLSGGEGKRVSIAVELALTQLNNFPILLLDECLNGLDEELKESVLDVFHDLIGNKAILCIMHDGVGMYDSVLSLDN